MKRAWDSALTRAANETALICRELQHLDAATLGVRGPERDAHLRIKASTYVWLGAVTENFVGAWVDALCSEVNQAGVPWSDLRFSLFSIGCGGHFDAFAGGRGRSAWERRVAMFDMTQSAQPAVLQVAHTPLDGRTIRPIHLENLWLVFGLPGDPFPSLLHRAILNSIADYRNDLAHGRENPLKFGTRFTYTDVLRHIAKIEDCIEHMVLRSETYLQSQSYLR